VTQASGGPARRERITARLREQFAPAHLEVVDESHLHAGHAGARSGAGHFRVRIVSERFAGEGRIARQRMVYAALADQMGPEIHALSLETLAPEEWSGARPLEG
jgi:BolA protein